VKFWDEWKGLVETASIVIVGQSVLGLEPIIIRGVIGFYLARRASSVLRHYPLVRNGNWIDDNNCEAGWYVGKQFLGYALMDSFYLFTKPTIEWDMIAHHLLFMSFQFYIILRQKSLGSLLRILQTEAMPFLSMCIHLLQARDRRKLPDRDFWRKRILFLALLRIIGFAVWRPSLWYRIGIRHFALWQQKNKPWTERLHGISFAVGAVTVLFLDVRWSIEMSNQLSRWIQRRQRHLTTIY
jgi:hypothetical protein